MSDQQKLPNDPGARQAEEPEEDFDLDPDALDRINRAGIVCASCGCDLHIDGTCPEGCSTDATTGEEHL